MIFIIFPLPLKFLLNSLFDQFRLRRDCLHDGRYQVTILYYSREGFVSAGMQIGQLVHVNLAGVLGISSLDDPVCIVSEYSEFGDLYHFYLNQTTAWSKQNIAEFRYKCLEEQVKEQVKKKTCILVLKVSA